MALFAAINKCKADGEVSMGREVETLTLVANASTLEAIKPVLGDVLAATRCQDAPRSTPRPNALAVGSRGSCSVMRGSAPASTLS